MFGASWWWQRCHSHFPQRWNNVEIGSPALGVLTLGIRIHNRMGRNWTNYPDTSLRGICKWRQGNGKQNWHPLNNPLTFVFSLKKAVCVTLWHACTNTLYLSPEDSFVHIFIYVWVVVFIIIFSQMRTGTLNVGDCLWEFLDIVFREMERGEKLVILKQQLQDEPKKSTKLNTKLMLPLMKGNNHKKLRDSKYLFNYQN